MFRGQGGLHFQRRPILSNCEKVLSRAEVNCVSLNHPLSDPLLALPRHARQVRSPSQARAGLETFYATHTTSFMGYELLMLSTSPPLMEELGCSWFLPVWPWPRAMWPLQAWRLYPRPCADAAPLSVPAGIRASCRPVLSSIPQVILTMMTDTNNKNSSPSTNHNFLQ